VNHHRSRCNGASLVAFAALTLLFAGCTKDPGYLPVVGRVQFKGEDIKEGLIQFSRSGEQSIYAGASIKNGRYEVPKDHGLKPGSYVARISAAERVKGGGEMNPFLSRETIPAKYNAQSNLTVEVRAGEPATFDFTLD
jgi:hypothetical protein